ncbi:MAG: OmpA family protein [Tannerellaceae bacterium]|nr:OmpA family protein [Tannerellaceae bacterium]
MLRIFDSLKSLVSPELTSKASALLGEDNTKVSTAISTVIASMLAAILQKGDNNTVKTVLEDAGKSNILTDIKGVFANNISMKQKSIGNDFLGAILGTKKNEFENVIANTSGITNQSANKLVTMIAPVVAGFLGNKLATNGYSMSGLISQLNEERHSFMGFVPSGIANLYGLSSVSDMGTKVNTKYVDTDKKVYVDEPKKGGGWWKWLLLLILLLLLFFWWRSCNRTHYDDNEYVEYSETYVAPVDTTNQYRDNAVNTDKERISTTVPLANGDSLRAYKGGIEERMVKYLDSDDYKNATADDLKKKTFEFDNITFEFGSATQMTPGSQQQIDNIASILKQYKNAKVMIVGNADKKGTDEANMSISQQRAKHVEDLLEKAGVGSQVVRAVGEGDSNADHPASDTDSQRREDRDIYLRFVK